jgi:hypothetical protein
MPALQVFQCPACGANINYNGGSEIAITCQYCGTSVIVPEELRSHGATFPAMQPTGLEAYVPEAPQGGVVLTGLALNIAVADWLLAQASEQTGIRVADDPQVNQRIKQATEKAMFELKTQETVSISLPFLTADASGPKHFETNLTRKVVDELARGTSNH